MVERKREPCTAHIRIRRGCELHDTVSVLGDAKPKKEDITVAEKRVNLDGYKRTHKNSFRFTKEALGANGLIFWSGNDTETDHERLHTEGVEGEPVNDTEAVDIDEDDRDLPEPGHSETLKRPSAYVDLFQTMISTVIAHEAHLLSSLELDAAEKFAKLSYNARYLLVRLSLRKPDKWHRLSSLKYQSEMGDADRIISAIQELSCDAKADARKKEMEEAAREVIDLTLDDDDDDQATPIQPYIAPIPPPEVKGDTDDLQLEASVSGSTSISRTVLDDTQNTDLELDLTVFADDESKMSLHDLLRCMTTDELKGLARQIKIKTTQNRPALISSLLASSTQATISFPLSGKPKGYCAGSRQTLLSFPYFGNCKRKGPRTQAERLREIVLEVLGKCIRINTGLYKFFKCVDLIYFRGTERTQTLLTPALLTRFRKRFYPSYEYTRTSDIWRSREELLAYEEALELEALIGSMVDGTDPTRAEIHVRSASTTLGTSRVPATRTPTPKIAADNKENRPVDVELRSEGVEVGVEEDVKPESAKVQNARRAREIFVELVYPRWKELVRTRWEAGYVSGAETVICHNTKDDGEEVYVNMHECDVGGYAHPDVSMQRAALGRFDCGYVYTRIVHKCLQVLATLKEYAFELDVLENLLAQPFWRKGKRGRWYERRALILMTYCGKGESTMKTARDAVIEALKDDDTHVVYRPMLVRRLARLEKKLKIPPEECHQCEGILLESDEIHLEGVRIWKTSDTVDQIIHSNGRSSATPVRTGPTNGKGRARSVTTADPERGWWRGKSIWQGRNHEEVNVETFALQHYEKSGYKGFHSEGSIVCTLFGLLFFDIIFASIPGAFETPYQSAPLDIAEDTFYYARKHLIEVRLLEIEGGAAKEILEQVDLEHREKGTWCVGVRWDLFERQDLIEIVQCLGGKPLAAICRLFCEDYAGRGGGVPDLFIWNARSNICKFVEVKGPGDSLQENQKLWIDVLLRSGIPVEVCHVCERGKTAKKKRTKTRVSEGKVNAKKTKQESEVHHEVVVESEDESSTLPSPSKKRRV